jgi:hypothetical protein
MQERGMNIYEACPHCGARMNVVNLGRHQEKCIEGPYGKQVFSFILSIAEGGIMPKLKEYDAKRPKELPNGKLISEWMGGWKQIAARCGLLVKRKETSYQPRLTKVEKQATAVDAWCDAAAAKTYRILAKDAHMAGSLMALHGWQERTYTHCGRTYRESYTVLR